jgi:flavin reductase (DIM6/NTAB) family NADH-FMN oxidoreductase RutF
VSMDQSLFKAGMRRLCGAVNLLAAEHEGARVGITVSAMTSLTAAPPRLLACVNIGGRAFQTISKARAMTVNVLSLHQEDLARRFAGMQGEGDHFAVADWGTMVTGAPFLVGALVAFDCQVSDMFVTHTHAIIIGDVVGVTLGDDRAPLLYLDGAFSTAAQPALA